MATSVSPKKNYRAALLRPAPPVPKIHIYSPPTQQLPYDTLVNDCIGNVIHAKPGIVENPEYDAHALRAVVEFEEEELKQYQGKKGIFNTKLEEILTWLSKKLNKNVLVFVGHSDVVEEYFYYLNTLIYNKLYSRKKDGEELPFNPELETIVLLIGCYTGEFAYRMNTDGYIEEGDPWNTPRSPHNPYAYISDMKMYFFGFKNLMHIYQAELFMCQEPQTKIKTMSCLYPKALEDKEELLREPDDKTNPLRRCCQAKYDRFKSMFVEDLNTRNCVKFTKEEILAKIKKTLKEDGTIDTVKIKNANYCMFRSEDGVTCPSPACLIKNPYKGAERYAESFDKAQTLMMLGHDLYMYAFENTDEKIANKLQSLKPDQQSVVWMKNFLIPSEVLIFELLFYQRYKAVATCIKLFPVPLHTLGLENKTFFSWGADLTDVDEAKTYELFNLFLKKTNKPKYTQGYYLRGFYDTFGRNALWYIIHSRRKMLLELYLSLTEDSAMVDWADNTEDFKPSLCLVTETYNFDPEFWRYLLAYGANPNLPIYEYAPLIPKSDRASQTVLEYILDIIPPPYPKEILMLLCIYGASAQTSVEKYLERYRKAINPESQEQKDMLIQASQSLEAIMGYVDNLQQKYQATPTKLETDWEYPINQFLLQNITAMINNPEQVFQEAIQTLELCLRIMKSSPQRKRKMQAKLTQQTKQSLHEIISAREKTLATRNQLPKLYKTLNQTLKRPNARVKQNMKKTMRNKGLFLLRNNTQSPENRATKLQELIDMVTGKEPETAPNTNFVGGRKTRKSSMRFMRR